MTDEERRVAFAEAVERSRLMLDAESCRQTADETVQRRVQHRDDGFSSDWAAGMPRRQPAPAPTQRSPSAAEIEALVDRRIAAALAEQRTIANARRDAVGEALGMVRAQMRKRDTGAN